LIEKVDLNDFYMVKFVAVALILTMREKSKRYLVVSDSSSVLTVLTSCPNVDVRQVVQLALQCKEFLAQNNQVFRPNLPVLFPGKSLSKDSKKEKKKSLGFIERLTGRQEKSANFNEIPQESKNHDNVYTDPCIGIIDKVKNILNEQKTHRVLARDKLREAIKLLETLKSNLPYHNC
jgi:hypothetical protein